MTSEPQRLEAARAGQPWKKWGPYLSERQWGTVRENYSDNGDAWNYFPHDHACRRSGSAIPGAGETRKVPRSVKRVRRCVRATPPRYR
ncbi:MAG: hypothetical protein ICV62_10330, partial [Cyanobacteria bacterium Co-bin13]|nr:hypothetical protein [Cyanobacteria bacterium Co-bin13]